MIEFLSPISESVRDFIKDLPPGALGHHVVCYVENGSLPDMSNANIAILTVLESRSVNSDRLDKVDFDACRKALYSLFPGNWTSRIVDLGNIIAGESPEDSRFALKEIVSNLIKLNVIPVILGRTQSLAYAQYRAYDNLDQMVNLVNIDYKFDVGNADLPISGKSYMGKMIVDQPYNLLNYSVIGYQSFFNPPEEINLMEKLLFDTYRLGEVAADISLAEPVLRNADMIIMDACAIKRSEMSFDTNNNPNGFDGREICAIARYAGISNPVSSFGLYEIGQNLSESSAMLIGQILWYFIEGVNFRIPEDFTNDSLYTTYVVPLEDLDLVFKKSKRSERWWVKVPNFFNLCNKIKRPALLPCTHADYVDACNQKIPERWLRAQLKYEEKL